MKVVTAEQMRRIDRLTTEKTGIPSLTLMENAGRHVAEYLTRTCPDAKKVTILCGKGNNGGDGFVAARVLGESGALPQVALLARPAALKGDAAVNYDALVKSGQAVHALPSEEDWEARREDLLDCDVLVDALLGTGLSGPVHEPFAKVISDVNAARGSFFVLALDIPSGLSADSGDSPGIAVAADATVTFTAPKWGQLFPPNSESVGTLVVAPIGSPEKLYSEDEDLFLNLITSRDFSRLPLRRPSSSHKGDFGHALIVAGSRGKAGAAGLAGEAALRAGAGLVTVATPESSLVTVASYLREYMTEPLAETESGSISANAFGYGRFESLQAGKAVLALGPGLSTHPETVEFVRRAVRETELPLILDADALNALVGSVELLHDRRTEKVVITPHPGEMARLVGASSAEVQQQRVEVARRFAKEYGIYVVLKGYRTILAAPSGQVYVNPTGGPALAKAGSGDVLTGLLAGMMAQFSAAPMDTVVSLAVFLHGLTGDLAGSGSGEQSVLASDLIWLIESAWEDIKEAVDAYDQDLPYVVAGREY